MKKNIRLILADIDGTLQERGCPVNSVTSKALNKAHEEGICIGIASGRAVNAQMKAKAQEWHLNFEFDVLIGMNGGQIYDRETDETEVLYPLSCGTIRDIIGLMKPLHRNAFTYEGDHFIAMEHTSLIEDSAVRNQLAVETTGYDDPSLFWRHERNKVMYRFDPALTEETLAYLAQYGQDPRFCYVMGGPGILEFQDVRVNKGAAMLRYAEKKQIPVPEIMALGDEQNDYELLKEAGYGVCMRNGCEACRNIADAVTEYTAVEGGAGRFLLEHLLDE